jgi:tetratricopeptide (TPR) repeat protein
MFSHPVEVNLPVPTWLGNPRREAFYANDAMASLFTIPTGLRSRNRLADYHLGLLVRRQGRLDEAAGLFRHVLEIDREALGHGQETMPQHAETMPQHAETTPQHAGAAHLASLQELAHIDAARGDIGAALEGFRQVLAAQDELIPAFACLTPGRAGTSCCRPRGA